MKHLLLGIAACTLTLSSMAQLRCGTDIMRAQRIAEDPTFLERERQYEEEIQRLVADHAEFRGRDVVVTIPIVFHILHLNGNENISNAQILDQMRILNEDFRALNADLSNVIPEFQDRIGDAMIQFALPTKDPNGNCTNGIDRNMTPETNVGDDGSKQNPWPRDKYLNVWVANTMRNGVAGYAYYPSALTGAVGSLADGVILLNDYVGSIGTSTPGRSRALTHEIGHYLNLAHVWGNNNGEDGGTPPHMAVDCGDDGVEDTPITRGWSTCPNQNQWDDCTPGVKENVQNYMEYSYCSLMFTAGQSDRMRAALESATGDRSSTWTEENLRAVGIAEGHQAQCAPIADFYARTTTSLTGSQVIPYTPTVCTGVQVRFMDNSVGAFPTAWSWTFQDGEPATSTEQNPIVSFTSPGWKTVTLNASNDVGTGTKTNQYAVYIGGAPNYSTGAYSESFENTESLFPYFGTNYDDNNTAWNRFVGAGNSGNACARLNSGERNQLDLVDPNNDRDIDDLISPTMDLSGLISAELSFYYSYSSSTTTLANVTEVLEVSSSTDCGRTWQLRGFIDNEELINNGNNSQVPPAIWTQKTYTLPNSVRADNVRFRFRFTTSAFSGDLFIDDINVSGAVGLEDLTREDFMTLYPNPTNDQFTLAVYGMDRSNTELLIQDLRGATVFATILAPTGPNGVVLNSRELGLSEGMYLIRASNENGSNTQKLIIRR
ncbi:MAG: M43 family zinc metalloprotease [Flavobacteriales bacterium]